MIRLRRRAQPVTSPLANLFLIAGSVVAALLVCALFIVMAGANPLQAYWAMFAGAFGSTKGIIAVLIRATPLLLTGLGTTVAFRSAQWNIGGEGQIYLGALGATLVGLAFTDLPIWVHLPLAILGSFIAGGLWALIPALLKALRGVNEIITTLMFSYIAIFLIQYLVDGPLQGPSAFMPQTAVIAESAWYPLLIPPYRLHGGFILALVMVVAVYILLWRTSIGYALRAVGHNALAARYGGISVVKNVVLVMVISGGLSGLAGANEVLGFHYRLLEGISPGYGFTGIIVALLGRLNPIGLVASSLLFSGLIIGANSMQQVVGIPSAIAGIIQGVVVLFVLGTELLLDYRVVILWPWLGGREHVGADSY
jgi:simple sugar transport system permease protein